MLLWMAALLEASGAHPDMGLRLGRPFREAGLPAPQLVLQARLEGGSGGSIPRYMAESLRTLLPSAAGFEAPALPTTDPEALERQLREEVGTDGVLTAPPMVAAWCRLP